MSALFSNNAFTSTIYTKFLLKALKFASSTNDRGQVIDNLVEKIGDIIEIHFRREESGDYIFKYLRT